MLLFNIGFIFSVFPVNCNLQDEYTFQLICNPLDMFGYTGDKSKDTVPLKEVVIQLLSHVQLFATPWTAAYQASLCFTISQSLLKLTSIESVMLSDHFILCHPLLLLPSVFPSIRILSNGSALWIRWPKVCIVKAMVFSSSHVQMWELDHKEGWAPKDRCFRTVVLEKTLQSPLDSKEIQPVHPKGNQPWIFIGRTDAEAGIPTLTSVHDYLKKP